MKTKKLPPYVRARLDQNFQESRRVHEDTLSKSSLIRRVAEQSRMQKEKDRIYDLANAGSVEENVFRWE